jgi:fructosamine-3-kinase
MKRSSETYEAIADALSEALEQPVTVKNAEPLAGGDINDAVRLETSEGDFFAKTNRGDGPWFSVEARQLSVMRDACTILRIPEVVTYRDPEPGQTGWLVLELVERGRAGGDYEDRLAEGLAELHATGADAFGFDVDTYCGTTLQPNPRLESWVDFYRDHRILHQAKLMVDRGRTPARESRVFDRLANRLDDLLDGSARPSLIHGDLWSGNHFADGTGRPVLFDPAAYYAHPEAELGMMKLFGGFSESLYDRYREASGLARDWRERNPLYVLYHVMNHATLFGGGYADQAAGIARRFAG